MKKRDAVKAIIIKDKKEILFLWDPTFDDTDEKWDVPGGGKDNGETDIEALVRETREEAGISIKVIKPLGNWSFPVKRFDFFLSINAYLCEPLSTEVDITADPDKQHTKFRWIPINEAKKIELTPWLKEAVRNL